MQSKWSIFIKRYLSFSKKERNGVLLLTGTVVLLYAIGKWAPRYWATSSPKPAIVEQAMANLIVDSTNHQNTATHRYGERSTYRERINFKETDHEDLNAVLFRFDPNTLDAAGWQQLGVKAKTVATIQKYLSKGGKFKSPEDIRHIWGLSAALQDRLIPMVNIAAATRPAREKYSTLQPSLYPTASKPLVLDVNRADTTAFIALPGIGSKLAARIVAFRDKLGGFYSVQQVAETFGLPDSTFQLLLPRLQWQPYPVKKINLNTASLDELKIHPYLRFALANAIVQFRQQHGAYKRIEDIQQIMTITPELFKKLAPYLEVGESLN